LPLALPHVVSGDAEDFLVADGNRLAAEWIARWPDWPGPALVLAGPPGSGKSHLAGLWRRLSGAVLLDPVGQGVEAAFEAAAVGAVLIERLEHVAGDTGGEKTLLQLYNALKAGGGTMLLTASATPSGLPFVLPDLASRLNAAIVARIAPPDDALLRAIVLKLFADRQLSVGEDVIQVLLTRGERSVAGLAAAIAALDAASLEDRRKIDAQLAREIVAGFGAECS
jgi:chromosomal replication initiation ATPase DnaA